MKYQDFFPETYRLDVKDERDLFFETYVGECLVQYLLQLNICFAFLKVADCIL